MRNILPIFLLTIVVCCGCSTNRSLSSPDDPFEITNSQWVDSSQVILTQLERAEAQGVRYHPNKDEALKTKLALQSLLDLSETNHAPSQHLLAKLLIYLDQQKEKRKDVFELEPTLGSFRSEYSSNNLKEIATSMLREAADSGYPPAIQTLTDIGVDPIDSQMNEGLEPDDEDGFFGSIWGGIADSGEFLLDGSVYIGEAVYDGSVYAAESLRDGTVATVNAIQDAAPSGESVEKLVGAVAAVGIIAGAAVLSARYPHSSSGAPTPSMGYYPDGNVSDSTYDARSGNFYRWSKEIDGDTMVVGHNARTGSVWQTTIEADGDMTGLDSDGNRWTYSDSTGRYLNHGTGTVCYGRGLSRTCY